MKLSKITKKGQITLPAKLRKKLNTHIVHIDMVDDKIIITPARDLDGVFKNYALKDKSEKLLQKEKEAFGDSIKEKHSNN
ncbi:MAG TPA: AbrB/MazE/SpoVT family DNA-binding domain-containing protein [Spirochaetota bacterium]|nr:AbrB/MazE/SpoVT family DNA-binding domain-containing protein [Spirochaetota bacterium]HOK92266.1 AbrB/MazE/SpoVT family DNA-binding domain-containing protein [Spirochaetota bacterium]HPP95177.1 AbrB/MazE/SpoVT family DNA-binding domain-containing protein [Spirochaetota bacterium]